MSSNSIHSSVCQSVFNESKSVSCMKPKKLELNSSEIKQLIWKVRHRILQGHSFAKEEVQLIYVGFTQCLWPFTTLSYSIVCVSLGLLDTYSLLHTQLGRFVSFDISLCPKISTMSFGFFNTVYRNAS